MADNLLGLLQREKRRHHLGSQTIFIVPETIVRYLRVKRNEELKDRPTSFLLVLKH